VEDANVQESIDALVDEEHDLLRRAEQEHGLDPAEHARLEQVKVQLDQCWDLLRQRRARRAAGQDPDAAEVRSPATVEGYLG
jgi:Protein of unknown function (DUF2630)